MEQNQWERPLGRPKTKRVGIIKNDVESLGEGSNRKKKKQMEKIKELGV